MKNIQSHLQNMCDKENSQRKKFNLLYGKFLPDNIIPGLLEEAPTFSISMGSYKTQLPQVDLAKTKFPTTGPITSFDESFQNPNFEDIFLSSDLGNTIQFKDDPSQIIKILTREIETQKTHIQQHFKDTISSLENEVNELKKVKQTVIQTTNEIDVKKYLDEIQDLKKELEETQNRKSGVGSGNEENLKILISDLNSICENEKNKNTELQDEIKKIQLEFENSTNENKSLKSEVQSLLNKNEQQEKLNEKLKFENEEMKQRIKQLESTSNTIIIEDIKYTSDDIKSLQLKNKDIEIKNEEIQKEYQNTLESLEKMKKDFIQLNEKEVELEKNLKEMSEKDNDKIKALYSQNDVLNKQVLQLQEYIDNVKIEKQKLRDSFAKINENIKNTYNPVGDVYKKHFEDNLKILTEYEKSIKNVLKMLLLIANVHHDQKMVSKLENIEKDNEYGNLFRDDFSNDFLKMILKHSFNMNK